MRPKAIRGAACTSRKGDASCPRAGKSRQAVAEMFSMREARLSQRFGPAFFECIRMLGRGARAQVDVARNPVPQAVCQCSSSDRNVAVSSSAKALPYGEYFVVEMCVLCDVSTARDRDRRFQGACPMRSFRRKEFQEYILEECRRRRQVCAPPAGPPSRPHTTLPGGLRAQEECPEAFSRTTKRTSAHWSALRDREQRQSPPRPEWQPAHSRTARHRSPSPRCDSGSPVTRTFRRVRDVRSPVLPAKEPRCIAEPKPRCHAGDCTQQHRPRNLLRR